MRHDDTRGQGEETRVFIRRYGGKEPARERGHRTILCMDEMEGRSVQEKGNEEEKWGGTLTPPSPPAGWLYMQRLVVRLFNLANLYATHDNSDNRNAIAYITGNKNTCISLHADADMKPRRCHGFGRMHSIRKPIDKKNSSSYWGESYITKCGPPPTSPSRKEKG